MSSWREYKLEDLADIYNHVRVPLSAMERAQKQGQYPYYGASGIIDYVDEYLFDGEYVLISEDGENLKSRKTPIAFKAYGQFWVNNHAHIIQGKKPFLNDLIVYYFKNLDLNPYITGAVQPKLNKANLLEIPFDLPESEEEQKAIAEVLGSLDDKIDLLHRQNKTFEELAQTLFRQWFIEEAKEEWEEKPLKDICEIINGFAFKSGDYRENGRTIIRTMNFKNGFINNSDVVYIDIQEEVKYTKYQLQKNDFLLVMVGASLGNFAIVTNDILPALQNQNMWNFRTLGNVSQHYLNFAMRQIVEENISSASGSAREFFQKGQFYQFMITVPDNETMQLFNDNIEDFYSKIENNRLQIQTLENLRDTLLPKLLSGEVKIKDK